MKQFDSHEKQLNLNIPSPQHKIYLKHSAKKNISVILKRDDQIHPIVCGNKWRKLKFNLKHVSHNKIKQIISFGGAWSNHLHALGWCCKQLNVELIAFVRGEQSDNPSAMIKDLIGWGATINWINRAEYRLKQDPQWLGKLLEKYPQAEVIPEGGSNQLALKGVAELANELKQDNHQEIDYLCTAVGSGGTIAGLIKAFANSKTKIIGIPVVKGIEALNNTISELIHDTSLNHWQLIADYECGGFARYDQTIAEYIEEFYNQQGVLLEPIYTAKLLIAVDDLIYKGFFENNSTIVVLHSGGLQGLRGDSKYNLDSLLI